MTTATAIDSLPVGLLTYMRGFARRRNWQRLIARLGLAMLVLLTVGLIACLIDRIIALPGWIRFLLLVLDLALTGIVLWPALRGWPGNRTDWRRLAEQIERADPICGERLLTVTSRLLGKAEHAGSRAMLDRLARELSSDVDGRDVTALLPTRRVIRPWVAVSIVLLLTLILSLVPVLDLPSLAHRLVLPWSGLPRVTTTRLFVTPGNVDLVEGQPLHVRVSAERLGGGSVVLRLRRPGQAWTNRAISLDASGSFVSALGEVEHDIEYQLTGGDATSPLYLVRVLRRPIVTEFRIRYDYPAYTALAPAEVVSSSGVVEAPLGTTATIRIHASEPLAAATLTVGEQSLMMRQIGNDPHAREAQFTIGRDRKYELGMSSTRGMVGAASGTVRAVEDRPPQVRLLSPLQDQWLGPDSMMTIRYEAGDEYGIGLLELHVRVNPFGSDAADPERRGQPVRMFRPAIDLRIRTEGDSRRLVGGFPLDLGSLRLSSGDFASLRLRAEDRNGQVAMSDAVYVVASPRTVSQRDRRHLDALAEAEDAASRFIEASQPGSRHDAHEPLRELQLCLLKAIADAPTPSHADAVEPIADRLQQLATRAASPTSTPGTQPEPAAMMRPILSAIRAVLDARSAETLLADEQNIALVRALLPATDVPPVNQARRRIGRLEDRVRMGLERFQLRPDDPKRTNRLRSLAETSLNNSPITSEDLVAVAARWPDQLVASHGDLSLPDRLELAARSQTLRTDGDLIWARDLQRCATAARHIQAGVAPATARAATARRFASALAELQRDHRQRRTRQHSPWNHAESDETSAARQQMTEWANHPVASNAIATPDALPSAAAATAAAARQMEALVMQASAETASRNFSSALAIDRALAGEATPAARDSLASRFATAAAERWMSLIQSLDALVLQQDAIERELEDLATRGAPVTALGQRQQTLAHNMTELLNAQPRPQERARLDAAEAIAAIDRWLASLPAEIAAHDRLSDLTYELEEQLERVRDGLSAMEPFSRDTMPALTQVRRRLLPALVELRNAAQEQRETPQIVNALPQLVDETRSVLTDALDAVLHPDALLAAQFRTSRAARLLLAAREPADLQPARTELADASAALRRAWHDAVHRAAISRAARIPALAPVVSPARARSNTMRSAVSDADAPRPPPPDPGPVAPGYEDVVKAYLEATGQRRASPQPR